MVVEMQEKRRWTRRDVEFSVRVVFPTKGIREVQDARLPVLNLSEGGAALRTGSLSNLPAFFYIQFGADANDLVSCYVVGRTRDALHCEFAKELTTSEVDRIIAEQEALALFDALSGGSIDDLFAVQFG